MLFSPHVSTHLSEGNFPMIHHQRKKNLVQLQPRTEQEVVAVEEIGHSYVAVAAASISPSQGNAKMSSFVKMFK